MAIPNGTLYESLSDAARLQRVSSVTLFLSSEFSSFFAFWSQAAEMGSIAK